MAPVLAATVQWGLSSGRLGHGKKVGVVVSDQAADQAALNDYLLPDLKKAGITPMVETVAGRSERDGDHELGRPAGGREVQGRGRAVGLPAHPGNAFFPYIGAETSQQYYPQLLLSDYQSTIEVALGPDPASLRSRRSTARRA